MRNSQIFPAGRERKLPKSISDHERKFTQSYLSRERTMTGVFLTTFQICMPSEDGAGNVWKYRRPGRVVVVVADKPEELAKIIAQNIDLQPGELVEVTQHRQFETGREFFQAKP
jgi:hypothetical protein